MSLTQISRQGFDSAALYALSNAQGLCVELCSVGASILRVLCPDATGALKNIALTFENASDLCASGSYAGATIGPVAGRLRGGLLHVAGKRFPLAQNDGENTLHGGPHGLAQTHWLVEACGVDFVTFCCRLPDGLDGFPGNRDISVRYTLTAQNCLRVTYFAKTDRPTFLNLTNHTYWSLSGNFDANACAQTLALSADSVLYNDAAHLPTAAHSVQGTAFDFTHARTVRSAIETDPHNAQLANANGYNNAFLLRPNAAFAARLTDPVSGRRLTVHTDYPALVLYSGGYLQPSGCALALEAQYPPDVCEPALLPGQLYQHTICFAFDTV